MECTIEKVCEQKFDGIEKNFNEKISVANHRISDLENKSEEINNINNVLVELQLLSKLQREDGVKRDKSVEEMNKTQFEISNTLKILADNLSKTDVNVDKLDQKVDKLDQKVDTISDKDKVSILEFIKKFLYAGAGAAIALGVTKLFN